MAIIVAGRLKIRPGMRETFLEQSQSVVEAARKVDTCRDFAVSADLVDSERVNVFEKWDSREALEAFRSSGGRAAAFALVMAFEVGEYVVDN